MQVNKIAIDAMDIATRITRLIVYLLLAGVLALFLPVMRDSRAIEASFTNLINNMYRGVVEANLTAMETRKTVKQEREFLSTLEPQVLTVVHSADDAVLQLKATEEEAQSSLNDISSAATGTLTESRTAVAHIVPAEDELQRAIEASRHTLEAANATLTVAGERIGSPAVQATLNNLAATSAHTADLSASAAATMRDVQGEVHGFVQEKRRPFWYRVLHVFQ